MYRHKPSLFSWTNSSLSSQGPHPDKMKKCGYDVFKILPREGEVAPGQSITLQVRFSPPYPGKLTQHFQLLCKPAKETA